MHPHHVVTNAGPGSLTPKAALGAALVAAVLLTADLTAQPTVVPAWPTKGIEVRVEGTAPTIPTSLEVRTELVGLGKTAALAQASLATADQRALGALKSLVSKERIEILREPVVIEPPKEKTLQEGQIVGGPFIVALGHGGPAEPKTPQFAVRQTLILRRDGLKSRTSLERLQLLARILDVLQEASLPLGSTRGQDNAGRGIFLPVGVPGAPQTATAPTPRPAIRFFGDTAASEAAAGADALHRATALAGRLAALGGRNIGKPGSIDVVSSRPKDPASPETGPHTVNLRVVFELQ